MPDHSAKFSSYAKCLWMGGTDDALGMSITTAVVLQHIVADAAANAAREAGMQQA